MNHLRENNEVILYHKFNIFDPNKDSHRMMCCGDRMWTEPEAKGISKSNGIEAEKLKLLADGCDTTLVSNHAYKVIFMVHSRFI